MIVVLALFSSACLGGGGEAESNEVTVFAAFTADEEQLFRESFAAWEEETGNTVNYTGSSDFETLVTTRVEGGDPPDIAIFPQPGVLLDLAGRGNMRPLGDAIDLAAIEGTLIPGFLDAVEQDGETWGVPMRMAVKSIVWYPTPAFEEEGYSVPETYEDLQALEEQIRADGNVPWCLGMESGGATGWVATDWIEEFMLRVNGPEVYDQWVNHEIPFDDPQVVAAGEAFEELWSTEGNVLGGAQGIINSGFGESGNPMFDDPPGCFMHRQGNFITGFFPEDVQESLDDRVGTFYLPPITDGGFEGSPVLGGGDLAARIDTENPVADEFLQFLASAEFGGPWAEAGGWLSPHTTFDASLYPDETTRNVYQLAADADVFRFDGSDLMPGPVGAGSFWTQMVNWINGQEDLESALANIEQSWPTSTGADSTATPTGTDTGTGTETATE